MIPIISVVGWHNVGKTTLVERLVGEFRARGLRVAVIKHTGGAFELDQPGTDTTRFAEAGAEVIVISGEKKLAILERRADDAKLEELVRRLPAGVDLVITEGFKRAATPKIEVIRHGYEGPAIASEADRVVLMTDEPERVDWSGGVYHVSQVKEVADLLVGRGLAPKGPMHGDEQKR